VRYRRKVMPSFLTITYSTFDSTEKAKQRYICKKLFKVNNNVAIKLIIIKIKRAFFFKFQTDGVTAIYEYTGTYQYRIGYATATVKKSIKETMGYQPISF
jgi:hypothetical protein